MNDFSGKYWTSPDDLDDASRSREGEVAESEAAKPTTMKRRTFLELLALSFAAVSCDQFRKPVEKIVPVLDKPEYLVPGAAQWYASTCGGCPEACGVLVKVRDGRPIKLEGNPDHPMSRGGLCAVGQVSLLGLYDSHRLKGPLHNGQPMDWPQVDAEVRSKLRAAVQQNQKIVLLTGTLHSPSTRQVIEEFRRAFPTAEHITYEAVSYAAIRKAFEMTHGAAVLPAYRIERAQLLVSFGADFLGAWISPVEFARQYAGNRQRLVEEKRPFYHLQWESRLSLTGSNADERIPIAPTQHLPILLHLCRHVAERAGRSAFAAAELPALESNLQARIEKLAGQLWQQRGRSLILSGSNRLEEQALVNVLNALLENDGRTVDLGHPSQQHLAEDEKVAALVEEMQTGRIGALLLHEVNPVYSLPDGERFAEALAQAPLTVAFSRYPDETSARVDYVCPDHHELESWHDGEPQVGLFSLFQPTIRPLGNTRAFPESLLRSMGRAETYYDYLQNYWHAHIFPRQKQKRTFLKFWEQALHDGFVDVREEGAAAPRFRQANARMVIDNARAQVQQPADGLQLELHASHALHDGRHAANPYLLELPDPISKVTWSNYVAVAPSAAKQLGLRDGQFVRLSAGDRTLEIPVRIQPGQQPQTLSIALGYGRDKAGPFGSGVGVNAFPLISHTNTGRHFAGQPLQLEPLPKFKEFALTQTEDLLHDRPILLETALAELRKGKHDEHGHDLDSMVLWQGHEFDHHKWEMAIDLNKCIGCSACLVACEIENNIPVVGEEEVRRRREMHWLRLDRYYKGDPQNPEVRHQPMLCQQCDNAPCESVCPVLATVQSSEGLNMQVYNRCVGTRFCANNCPYKVRRFNWFDYPRNDLSANLILNPDVTVRERGVMEKCSFCVQRIEAAKIAAKKERRPVRDGEIQPACQQSCPADAIVFGDVNDPESRIAHSQHDARAFKVLEDLYVKPAVTYLKKVTQDV